MTLSNGHPPSDRSGIRSLLRMVPWFCLFWSAVGVVFALPALRSDGFKPATLWASLAQWWSWGLLTPAIWLVVRLLHHRGRSNAVRVLAHLAAAVVMATASLYLTTAISALFGLAAWTSLLAPSLLDGALSGGILWGLIVYGLIAGMAEASISRKRLVAAALRAEQVERAYTAARLHMLRLQLDPHFLFNALNTISAEVTRDAGTARAMIEHLATLLRLSLDETSRHAVPLAHELVLLEHYLTIQRARFGDRLTVRIDVPDAVAVALVPSLLLQPLVENAIRHGIGPRRAGGTVSVVARRTSEGLRITVSDDGVGLPVGWSAIEGAADGPKGGVGLSVTRERVRQFGPDGNGRMEINRRPGGGTEAVLDLPLVTADA